MNSLFPLCAASNEDTTFYGHTFTHTITTPQGRSKGRAWGGLSPPKILVQHIIYKRIHVDVIVRAAPQIEHFPVLQAAREFRTRKCGQPSINP